MDFVGASECNVHKPLVVDRYVLTISLSECPEGLQCDSTIQTHYHKFRHMTLALMRSGVNITECQQSCHTKHAGRTMSSVLVEVGVWGGYRSDNVTRQDLGR